MYVFTELLLLVCPFPSQMMFVEEAVLPYTRAPPADTFWRPIPIILRTIELKYPPLHLRSVSVCVMYTDRVYIDSQQHHPKNSAQGTVGIFLIFQDSKQNDKNSIFFRV